MSIVLVIMIGLFVGWLVAAFLEFDEGMFAHMAVGALGALSGALAENLMERDMGMVRFEWTTVLWCVLGALFVTGVAGLAKNPNKNSDV